MSFLLSTALSCQIGDSLSVTVGSALRVGREKLVNREVNFGEHGTGVVFACAAAFLAGNAVVVRRNKKLAVALKAYYGKLTQRYQNALCAVVEHQRRGEEAGNKIRYFNYIALAGNIAGLGKSHAEDYGVDRLNICGRELCLYGKLRVNGAGHHV